MVYYGISTYKCNFLQRQIIINFDKTIVNLIKIKIIQTIAMDKNVKA